MIELLEQSGHVKHTGSPPLVASLENVDKNYGDVRALHGVNFQVRAGEWSHYSVRTEREKPPQ